jgi:hypothetical protein
MVDIEELLVKLVLKDLEITNDSTARESTLKLIWSVIRSNKVDRNSKSLLTNYPTKFVNWVIDYKKYIKEYYDMPDESECDSNFINFLKSKTKVNYDTFGKDNFCKFSKIVDDQKKLIKLILDDFKELKISEEYLEPYVNDSTERLISKYVKLDSTYDYFLNWILNYKDYIEDFYS